MSFKSFYKQNQKIFACQFNAIKHVTLFVDNYVLPFVYIYISLDVIKNNILAGYFQM